MPCHSSSSLSKLKVLDFWSSTRYRAVNQRRPRYVLYSINNATKLVYGQPRHPPILIHRSTKSANRRMASLVSYAMIVEWQSDWKAIRRWANWDRVARSRVNWTRLNQFHSALILRFLNNRRTNLCGCQRRLLCQQEGKQDQHRLTGNPA
jgi:hypothetical protein